MQSSYEWATRVGDAEKNETLNREISPYYHVDKIRAPLLIGQGANDPRVPQPESDQMFSAMKAKGLDVQYVLYPGGCGLFNCCFVEGFRAWWSTRNFVRHNGKGMDVQYVLYPGAILASVPDRV